MVEPCYQADISLMIFQVPWTQSSMDLNFTSPWLGELTHSHQPLLACAHIQSMLYMER